MPVKVNIQAQMHEALTESGLSLDEANQDPLLRFLLGSTDMHMETISDGPDAFIESTIAGGEAGADAAPGAEPESFEG